MNGEELQWSGGEHRFHLGIGQLKALQKRCGNVGPMHIFLRMSKGEWLVEDVTETIRLGLIGGGTSEKEARNLVEVEITDPGCYLDNLPLASNIIMISIAKPQLEQTESDDDEGDSDEGKTEAVMRTDYRMDKSTSKKSTNQEQRSDSHQDK